MAFYQIHYVLLLAHPGGCVLSTLFYILYTNMFQSKQGNRTLLKFADDTVIVSLLHDNDESFLELNISKTKAVIIDIRTPAWINMIIKNQTVDLAESYKYPRAVVDLKLTFKYNCEAVCKKGHQCLFCLRKLFSP